MSLGVLDGTDQEGEILPHTIGLQVKCGTNDHKGYRQYSVGTRRIDNEGNVILH